MSENLPFRLDKAFCVRSKISYYPLSHSLLPVPDGLSAVIFENTDDITEYYQLRGITDHENFEISRIGSIYDFMREVADIGYASIWLYNSMPLLFGNYVSEIDIELPSLLYTFQGQFMGAAGSMEKPFGFLPWRNSFKTDKIIRRFIGFRNGLPYDFSSDLFTLVYKDKSQGDILIGANLGTINYCKFVDASPLQGSYVSDIGAYCLFTDSDYALRYVHNKSMEEKIDIQKVELNQYLADLAPLIPFVDIGINPGNERYLQGYFLRNTNGTLVKTVHGLFAVDRAGTLEKVDETLYDLNQDTIDKPNTIDPYLRGFLSTIRNPLKYIIGSSQSTLTRKEAGIAIKKLLSNNKYAGWAQENSQFQTERFDISSISSDSYLVYGFDKVTGDSFSNNDEMIKPYVFKDIFDALLYFYSVQFDFEYDLRFNGYVHCVSNSEVKGTRDKDREDYLISENRAALIELMELILTEGCKIEHSELLMNYINRTSLSLEIEACGYLGDLAFFKEFMVDESFSDFDDEDNEITRKIRSIANSYKDKQSNKTDSNEKHQNLIKRHLGHTYNNLSGESKTILETACE